MNFIENALKCELVWIACRHHVFEVMLSDVLSATVVTGSGPEIGVLKRFQTQWPFINKSSVEAAGDGAFFGMPNGFCRRWCHCILVWSEIKHLLHWGKTFWYFSVHFVLLHYLIRVLMNTRRQQRWATLQRITCAKQDWCSGVLKTKTFDHLTPVSEYVTSLWMTCFQQMDRGSQIILIEASHWIVRWRDISEHERKGYTCESSDRLSWTRYLSSKAASVHW